MVEFVVIYHSPHPRKKEIQDMSPNELSEWKERWTKWIEKCGEHIVDMGAPLRNGKRTDASGTTTSKTDVAGYSILKADDMAKVEELLDGHPHLEGGDGYYIEIHEKMSIPC